MTDGNPYLGVLGDLERVQYGEALMSGVDEKVVRQMEGERAIGTRAFAATLRMERGRYRVKRGRPVRGVLITTKDAQPTWVAKNVPFPPYIKGNRGVVKVALMDNAANVLCAVTLKGVNPFDWKPGETIAQSAEFAFPKNAKGTKLALGVFTSEALKNPDVKPGIDHGTDLNWCVLTDMPRGEE